MVELPFEIITHILSFSSVEPLLRFRCLSQKFCDLIDGPNFIKTHLNLSIQNNTNNPTLILQDSDYQPYNHTHYSLKANLALILQNTTTPYSLYSPILINNDYPRLNCWVLGSWNGLILLQQIHGDVLVLLNPSTRQHRFVPPARPRCSRSPQSPNYGLGYDSFNDDYKVVMVVLTDNGNFDAKVYSLKSDLWQNIPYSDYFIHVTWRSTWRAQVNGAIHTMVSGWFNHSLLLRIVAFDVAKTNFYLVPTPDYVTKGVEMSVDVLGGCFCLIDTYMDYTDVWVMNVYGVKESWTKLFSISSPGVTYDSVRLLGYSKSGNEVILSLNGNKLTWYDLKREIKNVGVSYLPNMYFRELCVESLVPLDGYGRSGDPRRNIRKREKEANA